MTDAQRRAINRHNARKSTGPNTPEGKDQSRQNALKHGLCAATLALPIEDADAMQAEFDGWIAHYQPVGPAEFALVKDIARSELKINRCVRREAAVIASQVRSAYKTWDDRQEDRLLALKALISTDPAQAVSELKRFGAGGRWLIDRWRTLGRWFVREGYCDSPKLMDEAIRLLGMSPTALQRGPVLAFKFVLWCSLGRPEPDQEYAEWLMSNEGIHPDYLVEEDRNLPDSEECRAQVRAVVTAEIAELSLDEQEWLPNERAEVNGACERALLPADDPDSRLALRYETNARAVRDKALKMLEHLQNERFAVEALDDDAPAVVPVDTPVEPAPNEAETPPESPPSADTQSSCDSSTSTNPDVLKSEPSGKEATEAIVTVAASGCPGLASAHALPVPADARVEDKPRHFQSATDSSGAAPTDSKISAERTQN